MCTIFVLKRSIRQDRLGINTGTVEKKGVVCRRVHRKIKQLLGADMPADFKFVIARKSLQAEIPKKETGDYEDFLCGVETNALF